MGHLIVLKTYSLIDFYGNSNIESILIDPTIRLQPEAFSCDSPYVDHTVWFILNELDWSMDSYLGRNVDPGLDSARLSELDSLSLM